MTVSATNRTPGEALRFLAVGGINTVMTAAIFLALSAVIGPTLAYTVAFVVGIAFALVVTPRIVFKARATRSQRVRYLVWYLTIYALGLGIVQVLHDVLALNSLAVAAGTFVVTAGLSFLGARLVFERASSNATGGTYR